MHDYCHTTLQHADKILAMASYIHIIYIILVEMQDIGGEPEQSACTCMHVQDMELLHAHDCHQNVTEQ